MGITQAYTQRARANPRDTTWLNPTFNVAIFKKENVKYSSYLLCLSLKFILLPENVYYQRIFLPQTVLAVWKLDCDVNQSE
jgi:hypothetical protein